MHIYFTPTLANIIVNYFERGGPIMWPLLVALVAALTVVLERAIWWWGLWQRTHGPALERSFDAIGAGEFSTALELTGDNADPFLRTLHDGLVHAHSSLLGAMQLRASKELEAGERLQWVLGTLITLAPLLGLLGTVTGIMGTFEKLDNTELAPAQLTAGIYQALIATACGLGIAILCLLPYNLFNRLLARFRAQLERAINHTELLAVSAKHHGHDLEEFARQRAVGDDVLVSKELQYK